jgi:phosphohistidine phosphatase
MVKLYVMRHGKAEGYVTSDAKRKLIKRGKHKTALIGEWFQEQNPNIQRLISSPYTRARQTAGIMKNELDFSGEIELNSNLTPDGDITQFLKDFSEIEEDTLITSHCPFVEFLIRVLSAKNESLIMKTSSLACLEFDHAIVAGFGDLAWKYDPSEIATL